jgi:hypothetical protein
VTARARLTLADDAADLGDGQLLAAEQGDQAQARRLGDGAKRADEVVEVEAGAGRGAQQRGCLPAA